MHSLQTQFGGRIRPEIAVMQTTSISGQSAGSPCGRRSLLCFEMQGVCVAAASGLAVGVLPSRAATVCTAPLDKLHTSALRRLTQTEVAAVPLKRLRCQC